MKHRDNPYSKKRNKLVLWYVLVFAAAFLLAMAFFALEGATGAEFFGVLGLAACVVGSVCLVLLVPLLVCVVKLTLQAKAYAQRQSAVPAPPKVVTDVMGESQTEDVSGRFGYHYAKMYHREMGPWGGIIALLFMLPPLGVLFAFYKAYREPQHAFSSSITLRAVGYVLTGFGVALAVFVALIGIDETDVLIKAMVFPAACVAVAAFMLAYAGVLNKKARLVARFEKLVWIDAVLNIDMLAAEMGMTYSDTVSTLQGLIDEGFLYSCFIDFAKREVVSPLRLPKTAKKCRKCGSTTTYIAGTIAVCDYCGRFLK